MKKIATRKYSSRMCTICYSGCWGGGACPGDVCGGVSTQLGVCPGNICPGGCLPSRRRGVYPGDVCLGGVCLEVVCPGGVSTKGVSAQEGWLPKKGVYSGGVSVPVHAEIHTSPCEQNHRCLSNITFLQLLLRTVKIAYCGLASPPQGTPGSATVLFKLVHLRY